MHQYIPNYLTPPLVLNPPPLFRDLDQRYVQGSGREDRKFSPDFLDCTQLQYSGTQLHDIALGYNLLPTTWLVLGHNCSVFRREIAYYKVNFQKFRLRRYLQYIFDSRIATAPSINVKTKIWARRRRKKSYFWISKIADLQGKSMKKRSKNLTRLSDCTWVKFELRLYLGQVWAQIVLGSNGLSVSDRTWVK